MQRIERHMTNPRELGEMVRLNGGESEGHPRTLPRTHSGLDRKNDVDRAHEIGMEHAARVPRILQFCSKRGRGVGTLMFRNEGATMIKRMLVVGAVVIAVGGLSGSAWACGSGGGGGKQQSAQKQGGRKGKQAEARKDDISKYDKDGDGKLSPEERAAAREGKRA
jgi:hypothetical protein